MRRNKQGARGGFGFVTCSLIIVTSALSGCQQKMADQPAHRPYEESDLFAHKQSVRPIEKGVIHRNQLLADDPLITWLTKDGKEPKASEEWRKEVDPTGTGVLEPGTPTSVANFVKELPFTPAKADYERGQLLYNANCALCHGAAGHANGKIPERGYLRPPSYHYDPLGEKKDWSKFVVPSEGGKGTVPDYTGNPQGSSRGFYKYGIVATLGKASDEQKKLLKDKYKLTTDVQEVPAGYIFQVITWGYGGMASHETQIPDPADRWRVVAYIRALQLSQNADPHDAKVKAAVDAAAAHKPGEKKSDAAHKDGEKH